MSRPVVQGTSSHSPNAPQTVPSRSLSASNLNRGVAGDDLKIRDVFFFSAMLYLWAIPRVRHFVLNGKQQPKRDGPL